jgi:hypothetical protein
MSSSQSDTLRITLGEGVRGRIDTTIVYSGPIGADATRTVTLVLPRGHKVQYSFVADRGYHNLLVVLDDDSVAARGTLVLDGDRELMAGAERRVAFSNENRRPIPPTTVRRGTLLRIDGTLGEDEDELGG